MPDALRLALQDAHDTAPALAAVTAHLESLRSATDDELPGVPPEALHSLAVEMCALLGEDDHQLAKVMVAFWRGPALEHRLLAAACAGALGAADLKRLLRFLQKAEKRLPDAASCDALAAGCEVHVRTHPALFLREARNRLSTRRPLIRRLGLMLLAPLAGDPAFADLDALFEIVRPQLADADPLVHDACTCVLREAFARDADSTRAFLASALEDAAAGVMLANLTAEQQNAGAKDSVS